MGDITNYRCCGNCKHWKQWDSKRCLEHDIASAQFSLKEGLSGYFSAVHSTCRLGDCDKIEKDRPYYSDGHDHVYTFDGYSFEDECYDEYFNCFEDDNDQECRIY